MMVVALVLFLLSVPLLADAGILINEIAWMGSLAEGGESVAAAANDEWVELHNGGADAVSFEGWILTAEDGNPNIALVGTIAGNGYFLLERGNDDVVPGVLADVVYAFKDNALSNSGERLMLKDGNGTVIDEVNASGSWPAGDNTTKETMQRAGASWMTAAPTPRAVNPNQSAVLPPAAPSPSPSPATPTPASSPSQPAYPSLTVASGDDRTVMVGSVIAFSGAARGIKNEPLDGARFWWNFGDGSAREGRNVTHTFVVPGTYTVGLHVSSGSYAGSDFLRVEVVPNSVAVISVAEGVDGFVMLKNPSSVDVDVGGWTLADALGASFVVPPKTMIGGSSTIAFLNNTTSLLANAAALPLAVHYPNGTVVFTFDFSPEERLPESIAESDVVPLSAIANEAPIVSKAAQVNLPFHSVRSDSGSDVEHPTTTSPSSLPDVTVTGTLPANDKGSDGQIAAVGQSGQQSAALFFATALFASAAAAAAFLFTRRHV